MATKGAGTRGGNKNGSARKNGKLDRRALIARLGGGLALTGLTGVRALGVPPGKDIPVSVPSTFKSTGAATPIKNVISRITVNPGGGVEISYRESRYKPTRISKRWTVVFDLEKDSATVICIPPTPVPEK